MIIRRLVLFLGLAFLVLVAASWFQGSSEIALAGSEHNLSGWAWSETIGWISFNSTNQGGGTNYGVTVALNGRLSGYAWSENIGWITFNQSDLGGCPSGQCRADFNKDTGQVTGWARALANGNGWDGWISLSGTNYGVTVNQYDWRGWAWGSDVIGWVSFNVSNFGDGGGGGGGGGGTYGVVGSGDAGTLFVVSLSASPSSGFAPLSTTLTATVSGGEGTINYTFWWNCNNGSSNVSIAIAACGDPTNPVIGAKFDGVTEISKNVAHIYSAVGSYTAKIIVERGTRADEERIAISANQPPEDFSLSSSNDIEVNITSAPVATSTETIISILPLFGYNSSVTLSVDSITPSLPEVIYNLRNNTNGQESSGSSPTMVLTSGQFSAGADFWVGVPRDSALQEYTVKIKGEGGGKIRFVDVKLNAKVISPDFKEI